jgi:hypothetical protein
MPARAQPSATKKMTRNFMTVNRNFLAEDAFFVFFAAPLGEGLEVEPMNVLLINKK